MLAAMKARALVMYWMILLAATLAAGAWMFQLLRGEQRRIESERRAALEVKARSVADDVILVVEQAKDAALSLVAALGPNPTPDALARLEREQPLIRNAFRWSRDRGIEYPLASDGLSSEQDNFLKRYQRLLAGTEAWPDAGRKSDADGGLSSRVQLWKAATSAAPVATQRGWLTWFWEDELFELGWIESADRAMRFGVELEMPAVLSRVATALPPTADGQVMAIVDGNGRIFAQRGGREITNTVAAIATASLGPALPHWSISIYEQRIAGAVAQSWRVTTGAMVAVLLLAILSAGSLLLWQAGRSAREARRKTTFVSNVSHELKTPLTTIRLYAEMLTEGRVADDAKRHHYLGVITRESERLTRLVNNVLDFSRLEQGRKKYQLHRFDAAEAVRQLLAGQQDRLKEAGMALDSDIPATPVLVESDRDAIEQTLLNLLDNAVKYAAGGRRVRVVLGCDSEHWRLAVEDAGPGIAAGQRARLFQPFHRADDSITAGVPGFGLGLSISRRLVEDLGGTLSFEPAAGGGARFVMSFPKMKEPSS